MSVQQVPVWLDCDPGHDDAFAILLAAYHPAIRLLGISTVFGNASLSKTTNNTSSILTAIGKEKEVTIYPGASKPSVRPPIQHAPEIHGESGIDGTTLLPKGLAQVDTQTVAIDAMAEALLKEPPGTAWLVATGAVTNAAAAFQKYPQLVSHVAGLSIMGGAIGGGFSTAVMGMVDGVARIGNWSQYAEFNIVIDPEAAAWIFANPELSGKTTLVPLDLSHQVLATEEVQRMLLFGKGEEQSGKIGGKSTLRRMLVELLLFFAKTYADVFGITEGPPLHDPLAMAAILTGTPYEIPFYDRAPGSDASAPQERFTIAVVTEGNLEDAAHGCEVGRTVATLNAPGVPGVRIPRGLDIPAFWDAIEDCIRAADEVNAKRAV